MTLLWEPRLGGEIILEVRSVSEVRRPCKHAENICNDPVTGVAALMAICAAFALDSR